MVNIKATTSITNLHLNTLLDYWLIQCICFCFICSEQNIPNYSLKIWNDYVYLEDGGSHKFDILFFIGIAIN